MSPSPSLILTNEELVDIMTSAMGKLKLDSPVINVTTFRYCIFRPSVAKR